MNPMRFDEQVVLVTGASRGIGQETARQFAAQGAHVIVHYHRNETAARETAAGLAGGPHLVLQADVADSTAVAALIEESVAQFGRLDILVNNAAIYEEHPVAEVTYETWQTSWRRVLDTNLTGAANACYCAAQQMIRQGHGRIINVSSRGAFRGEPTSPAYGASKAGLNALSQSLAKYLAPYGISVAVVAPGWVETDMARDHLAGPQGDSIRAQSPFGRVARPQEVAYAILFLASAGAEFSSGAVLDVNGASYLRT